MRKILLLMLLVAVNFWSVQAQEFSVVGTGFFVTSSGHILTNNHVTANCRQLQIKISDGSTSDARLLATDPTNDLAILSTTFQPSTFAFFQRQFELGDSVYVYGFPLSGLLSSTGNFTSGMISATAGINDDSRMLQISAPVQPGNSGGPLLTETGAIVGVVSSKLDALKLVGLTQDIPQNVNFAIKSGAAVTFLEANGLSATITATASNKLEASRVAEVAKSIGVKVLCSGVKAETVAVQPPNEVPASQGPGPTRWNHNGSIMQLEANGPRRRFYYEKPRSGVAAVGVSQGTLLFDGSIAQGRYSGTAYYFHRTCGAVPYAVEGPILDDGRRVAVSGKAPRLDKGCKVTGYLNDTLEFVHLPAY